MGTWSDYSSYLLSAWKWAGSGLLLCVDYDLSWLDSFSYFDQFFSVVTNGSYQLVRQDLKIQGKKRDGRGVMTQPRTCFQSANRYEFWAGRQKATSWKNRHVIEALNIFTYYSSLVRGQCMSQKTILQHMDSYEYTGVSWPLGAHHKRYSTTTVQNLWVHRTSLDR